MSLYGLLVLIVQVMAVLVGFSVILSDAGDAAYGLLVALNVAAAGWIWWRVLRSG